MSVEQLVADFRSRQKAIRSKELMGELSKLGFNVRHGKKGGHMTYTHPRLPAFFGGNFNAGHGKNDYVKPVYIRNIANVLEEFASELDAMTKGK